MAPEPGKKGLSIAMVIDTYDDCKNGAVISTKRFVELLRPNHTVSIITTGNPAPGKILLHKFYPFGVRRIMKKMNTPLAVPSNRVLRRSLRGNDIVHVQFPFFLGLDAVRIARRLKIPVVTTFHIQAEHLALNAGIHSGNFIKYCYKFWMKYYFNRSDLVICPSRFAENELRSYGLKAPSVIISNGIAPIFRQIVVERPPGYNNKFIVISVGRFAPEKRQETIIQAIAGSKYREVIQLILIGEGPDRKKLGESGTSLPNPPLFLALSQEELVRYYNFSDLYIHAATIEVECMSVMEAMACGLPVLIAQSPKSATQQFALDERSLYPMDNVGELTKKLDYWIEHPTELANAKQRYSESSRHYRLESSFEKLLACYHHLVLG